MAVIKRIGIFSFAKIYSLMFAVIGLFEGSLLSFTMATNPAALEGAELFKQIGYAGIVVLPIAYALIGFVIGMVVTWVYNLFAKWIGGVEIELVLDKKPK